MAYTSGTAANYKDLLAVMATFAAANGWSILEQTAEKLYLKGTGTSGLDEIYCGAQAYEDAPNGKFIWELFGSWGYRSGRAFGSQPVTSTVGSMWIYSYFWNAAMPYWMFATPRRIIVVAKVSNVYTFVHLGLIDPPASDAQYPYPMLIGGMGGTYQAYSVSDASNCAFWEYAGAGVPTGRLSLPGGTWGRISNIATSTANPTITALSHNYASKSVMLTAHDGSYVLEPIYICDYGRPAIYGAIDGIFRVSGYQNSAENIITVSGVNYMVFPNAYRSGYGDYCAVRLN